MTRCARMCAASLAAGALSVSAATPGAHAARAAAVCKSFSVPGAGTIQWSVVGNVSCSKAAPWLKKILAKHGAPDAQAKVPAPTGFHCRATDNAKGIPSVGTCYTGTVQFPKNGFQWFG